jgi:hypothetical protein
VLGLPLMDRKVHSKLQFSSFHFPVSLYFSHENIEGVGTRSKLLEIEIVSISEGGRPESRDRERHQRIYRQ